MRMRTVISGFCVMVFATFAVSSATGRQQNGKREQRQSRWSALLNVDLMVNTYSRFLARKYDLTEEQDEFTRQYLTEQANTFMDANRDEVSDLIDRMFEVRAGGEMDQEDLIQWGKRIMPIYQEAKKMIVLGNGDWRDILTDDQKAIHDSDLKLMQQSFQTTEDQLARIVTGEMTVEEFRNPRMGANRRGARRTPVARPPQVAETDPPQQWEGAQGREDEPDRRRPTRSLGHGDPGMEGDFDAERADALARLKEAERADREMAPERVKTPATRAPKSRKPTRSTPKVSKKTSSKSGGKNFESTWESYTRKFIDKYALTEAQAQKANSILNDCQEQGRRHMARNKSRFAGIDKQLADLKSADKKDRAAKMLSLTKQQKKLSAPVDRIFEKQLKPRLEKLPTRAQRKAAESGSSKSRGKSGKKKGRP